MHLFFDWMNFGSPVGLRLMGNYSSCCSLLLIHIYYIRIVSRDIFLLSFLITETGSNQVFPVRRESRRCKTGFERKGSQEGQAWHRRPSDTQGKGQEKARRKT